MVMKAIISWTCQICTIPELVGNQQHGKKKKKSRNWRATKKN